MFREAFERGESLGAGDAANLLDAASGTILLRDGNGAIERDDRGRAYRHQRVVERNDRAPVRLLRAESAAAAELSQQQSADVAASFQAACVDVVLTTLKRAKIRGVDSYSMVCSEKELGITEEHEGIILLDDDAPVGMPMADYMGDAVLAALA